METPNKLIDQLISNQSSNGAGDAHITQDTEGQVLITTSRVVSIRYKIYVLALLVLVAYFCYSYLQPLYNDYVSTNAKLTNISAEIATFPIKKTHYEADSKLVTTITKQQNQIVSCLNYQLWCNQLDVSIQNNFGVARSYIQLNSLSAPKMLVDEKKILANINEYLIKKTSSDPSVISRSKNGNINNISIGEPKIWSWILSFVPIRINITFADKDSLLSFIDNVERNVLDDPAYRILYKLNEVSYDIVKYTDEQKVDILMYAYYIN